MEDESSPIAIETDCYYGVITSHCNGLPSSITTVFTKSEVLLIRNGYQATTKWKHKWKREKSNSDKLPLFHCRKTPREDSLSKANYLRNKVIYMELISWEQLLFLCFYAFAFNGLVQSISFRNLQTDECIHLGYVLGLFYEKHICSGNISKQKSKRKNTLCKFLYEVSRQRSKLD